MIPYTKHHVTDEDRAAVDRVLRSDRLTQGLEVERFESAFAEKVGAKYCVAVSSGTAALHLAYLACGVGPDRPIQTTPISFVATANAALYCGAEVWFDDVESRGEWYNLRWTGQTVGQSDYCRVPVGLGGRSPSWNPGWGQPVILDLSHGPFKMPPADAEVKAACYSFHASKHIGAGEGGSVVTNDVGISMSVRAYRNHGRIDCGPHGVEMHVLGTNARMDELSAALAYSQLQRLDWSIAERRRIAKVYDEAFLDCEQIEVVQGSDSVYHLYQILVSDRDRVRLELARSGVGSQIHYRPIHLEPYYRERFGYKDGDFPNAERFASRALSLPMYPTLTDGEQHHVIESVIACLGSG